jgi:hypothetical protein
MPSFENDAGHERDEVSVRGILGFALALLAIAMAILLLLRGVMNHFSTVELVGQAKQPPFLATPLKIAGPALQSHPAAERAERHEQELRRLNGYGWVDRDAGIAHIPIDRAIEILALRGLPEIKASPSLESVAPEKPASTKSSYKGGNSFRAARGRP